MISRIEPRNHPTQLCKVLVVVVLVVGVVHAGNLDFYQDVEPELPEDVAYKEIARYWEARKHLARAMPRAAVAPNLPYRTYDEYLDYRRQKEKKILETLLENPAILDVLENERTRGRDDDDVAAAAAAAAAAQWPPGFVPRDVLPDAGARPAPSYVSGNPAAAAYGRFADYSAVNANNPFVRSILKSDWTRDYVRDSDAEAERLLKLQARFADLEASRARLADLEASRARAEAPASSGMFGQEPRDRPEFTYEFDERPTKPDDDKFAIRPNDPRYYEDDDERATSALAESPSSSSSSHDRETTTRRVENSVVGQQDDPFARLDAELGAEAEFAALDNDDEIRDKFSLVKVVMPDRRAERDPVVVASTRMTNNDIYFIAIVAGCSAAAMFALVLIALTWCRLHRGAKAAADIEYPAYGVTGPNKDISPSGDQRLAHSAQMYHFQHQKQQIIAMENRTAASRDPGSVSEAESDEENEEGDYTVYECPGLASTGEMEVKNPMFHDDPTPATPPQIHKEEDHM